MNKPEIKPDSKINLDALKDQCELYIDTLDDPAKGSLKDLDHFIFEQALITLYGENVFKWINERIE